MTSTIDAPTETHATPSEPVLTPAVSRPFAKRFILGGSGDPSWARPTLLGLLLVTAVGYLWNLGINGYSNDFYAAAIQAGSHSWKAMFFGSFDSQSFITVDKPPASLWPMELSGRIFGFSSWSMLAPEALEGVAVVGLVYGCVHRLVGRGTGRNELGHAMGLVAAGLLAVTPVASLMFRFNNPDAFLLLLLTGATYCVVRALQSGRTPWLLGAGSLVGFGFLAKSGQGLLTLPAFGVAYLFFGPLGWGKRFLQLLAAFGTTLLSAGWWIAIVELTPAADRPFVGGSTDNSELGLAFGYNGLGRLFGGQGNGGGGAGRAAGGGGGGGGFSGTPGISRLFSGDMATEISWLLPAALLAMVAGLVITARRPRNDVARAGIVMFGVYLLVTAATFSFAKGTIHEYYTVALATPIAGLVGLGGALMIQARATWFGRVALAVTVGLTAIWDVHLLNITPDFYPVLRYTVGFAAVVAVAAILVGPRFKEVALVAAVSAVVVGVLGTSSFAVDNLGLAHTGSTPTSGPSTSGGFGGGGAGGGFGGGTGTRTRGTGTGTGFGGGTAPEGGFGGGAPGTGTAPGGTGTAPGGTGTGTAPGGTGTAPGGTGTGTAPGGAVGGGFGGGSTTESAALTTLLKDAATKWSAAATSSMTAGPLELASDTAVMSLGGFNGGDDAISLQGFEKLVAAGEVHYYIGGGQGGFGGRGRGGSASDSGSIASWVTANFTATTVGGTTVYDLTKSTTTAATAA